MGVRNVRVKETACSDQDWKRRVMETACKCRGIESAGKKPPVKLEVSLLEVSEMRRW